MEQHKVKVLPVFKTWQKWHEWQLWILFLLKQSQQKMSEKECNPFSMYFKEALILYVKHKITFVRFFPLQDLCARRLLDKDQKEDVSIMMVGHGGWLIQFMSYLASHESFCSNSSDAKVLSRLCPNTGVSQFEIRLGNNGAVSDIKCLSVHDRAHLNTTSIFCQDFAV